MLPLETLSPRDVSFSVLLGDSNPYEVRLHLRAFRLKDQAWIQQNFDEEKIKKITELDIETICQLIWRQLYPESQQLFSDITYEKFDEEKEEIIRVKPDGWERLMHSLHDEQQFIKAFDAYTRCRGLNGYMDENRLGHKKKVKENRLMKWITGLFSTESRTSTAGL